MKTKDAPTPEAVRTTRGSGWIIPIVLTVLAAGAMALQATRVSALRSDLARRAAQLRSAAEIRKDNDGLRKAARALETSAGEQDARLAAARAELESLRARRQPQPTHAPAARPATPDPSATAQPTRFVAGTTIAADEWRNVGNSTPEATLESSLWAAAGGDVDALARNLLFFGKSDRAAAQALLDALPPESRARYATPERLMAALTIPEVTMQEATVVEWGDLDASGSAYPALKFVRGMFSGPARKGTTVLLMAKQDDGWKVVVTAGIVARCATQLRGGAEKAK